ncbi:hypothetical protein HYT23_00495 [Candidatus Pacearchaeota archaeon]|nr:hypothetical protein [Candidatus Pacearchaeota archaeon]
MKLKLNKFQKLISKKELFNEALEKTKKEYRPLDPGQYLYNLLLEKRNKVDIFSDEYLELVYTILIAWNMNGRGAKLNDFDLFKDSIRKNRNKLNYLKRYSIEKLNEKEKNDVLEIIKVLFMELDLVGKNRSGKKIKSKLVTFSKTLHFLLPELIVPIDRRYTLAFFYNNTQVPTKPNSKSNDEKQIEIFNEIYNQFVELARIYHLKQYIDKKWNGNITKVIDNAIIGYSKLS